ncbi:MAG: (d)CMP kinase [Gammaproteobacteria bacterium]|nr:(d)CMP kinase [Gammaproteobacteria bacterium]
MTQTVPVITFDGLSGTGKGTISQRLAESLGWGCLDSGMLYRVFAWAVLRYQLSIEDVVTLMPALNAVQLELTPEQRLLADGHDITLEIRSEACSKMASKVSAIPEVRASLLDRQRAFRKAPGLVADGRDMGTVIFPDAVLKFYLTASPETRAERRFNQLKEKGINVSLREVREELVKRDYRDEHRDCSPAKPAPDVILIDTDKISVDEVFAIVSDHINRVF